MLAQISGPERRHRQTGQLAILFPDQGDCAALREGLKTYGPRDMVDIQSLIWVAASVKADAVAAVISPGELIRLTEIRECLAVEAERIPALAIQSPNRSQPEPAAGNPRAARDYTIFQIDQYPFGTVL